MEEYIHEKKHILTNELCDDIINNIKIRDNNNHNSKKANKLNLYESINFKESKLPSNIITSIMNEIKTSLNYLINKNNKNNTIEANYIILNENCELLKIEKDQGFISYSCEFNVILDANYFSFYDFLIFLNEGSIDIEIMGKIKIKGQKGKLLLIPSCWCFPYSYKQSIPEESYIIRGKIFQKNQFKNK